MGGKTGTTTQSVNIPPEVMARYNAVNARAENVAQQPFQQYSTDPSAFVAQLNQQQQTGIGNINQYATAAQPAYQAAMQGTSSAYAGLNPEGFQRGVQGYMSPFLQNAMGSTAAQMQNVARQQQQDILGNAVKAGAFGGDRGAVARSALANQQNLALGQTLGQMAQQGYQSAAQNYLTGMGQQGQLAAQMGALGAGAQAAGLQGAQAQLGAGTLQQQTEQAGKTALYNQFLQQQAYPFQVAQFLANIAMGTGALSGSQTTTTQPMSFFSDRRLKHDVERIGESDDGLPIYKYKYKEDPYQTTRIGFMAQDVEKKHPEAVGLAGGFKTVDYDKATKAEGGEISEGGAVMPQHSGLGFAYGGAPSAMDFGSYNPYDPNNLQNILARQQAAFSEAQAHGVPLARQLSGGLGKASRVPEANLPVGALRMPAAPPPQLQSMMDQGLEAADRGRKIAELFKTGTDEKGSKTLAQSIIDAFKGTKQNEPQNQPQNKKPDEEEKAYGGPAGSGDNKFETPEGLYSAEQTGKLNIPTESKNYKLAQQSMLPGSMQDPTMKDIMTLIGMFKAAGGRAGYATEGEVKDNVDPYLKALRQIESSHNYAALGPMTKKGDRAYGAYQVMGANVPSWTKTALGESMTPEEFLADKEAQDKVARHYFSKALDKYGNPQDAASVWFTGKPLAKTSAQTADITGTTVPKYIQRFNKAAGLGQTAGLDALSDEKPDWYKPEVTAQYKGLAGAQYAENEPTTKSDATQEVVDSGPTGGLAAGDEGYEAAKRQLTPHSVWSDIGKEMGIPEKYQDSNLFIPAIAGLGSMLSSRSPFFLPALGEGLVGGASAYTALQPQQAQIERTRAETMAVLQGIPRENFLPNGDVLVAGPNGEKMVMSAQEYAVTKILHPESIKLWSATGGKGPGSKGLAGAAEDAAGKTPGLNGAKTPPTYVAEPTDPMALSAEEQKAAADEAIALTSKYPNLADLQTARSNLRNAYKKQAEQAAPLQRNNTIYADLITSRDPSDITSGGPYAEWFNGIRSKIDQLSRLAGGDGFKPEEGANIEELQKLYAQTVSRVPSNSDTAAELELIGKTYPWLTNTNLGSAKNMAQIMVTTEADIDKNNLAQNLTDSTGKVGKYLPQGDYVGENFVKQFNAKSQPLQAKEAKILESMMTTPATNATGDAINDPKTGKPLTWFSLLSRYGQTFTPEQLGEIVAQFDDPYILRYFKNISKRPQLAATGG